jgi:hypothetical protein
MSRQLDILALEPFHGGARRAMLEALARCSRHRWTILKLPARRIERRLMVAATWFAEHLSRNGVGDVDLVFSSEALNLADFLRLRPDLANKPSVVYFHDNQLPDPLDGRLDTPTDLVNLNSAMAAREIWFNSLYNLRTFLSRASGLVSRHPELQTRSPLPGLTGKAQLVSPPIELTRLQEAAAAASATRDWAEKSILVDTRDADAAVLVEALSLLAARKDPPTKVTLIGKLKGLPASLRPTVLAERDEAAHVKALLESNVLMSARPRTASDDLAVRALAVGCLPVVPETGVYAEVLPEVLHLTCLHDGTPASIVSRVLDAWDADRDGGLQIHLDETLAPYDAIGACRVIDERLDALATPMASPPPEAKLKLSRPARDAAAVVP